MRADGGILQRAVAGLIVCWGLVTMGQQLSPPPMTAVSVPAEATVALHVAPRAPDRIAAVTVTVPREASAVSVQLVRRGAWVSCREETATTWRCRADVPRRLVGTVETRVDA